MTPSQCRARKSERVGCLNCGDQAQVDDKSKLQLRFYARQFVDAMSPGAVAQGHRSRENLLRGLGQNSWKICFRTVGNEISLR
jgi:hypothetical protein